MFSLNLAHSAWRRRVGADQSDAKVIDFAQELSDPSLSVIRPSAGSYLIDDTSVGWAAPNTARVSYDHLNDAHGLLIEPPATNLLIGSNGFATNAWSKYDFGSAGSLPSIVPDGAAAPDGTQTASIVTLDAGDATGQSSLQQRITTGAGDYVMSVWARVPDGADDLTIRLRMDYSGGAYAQNVVVTQTWQRVTLALQDAPDVKWAVISKLRPAAGTSVAGVLHLWGAQLETGLVPTSTILSNATAATRMGDQPSVQGVNGEYDVSVLMTNGDEQQFAAQDVSNGYWPDGLSGMPASMTLIPVT